jgi:hypothetical protein
MVGRALVVSLVCAVACGGEPVVSAGPSPPRAESLDAFVSALGTSICRRFIECCAEDQLLTLVGTTDEGECVASLTVAAREQAALALSYDGIVYDAVAGGRCVQDVRALPCPALFEPKAAGIIPCHHVFPGTFPVGHDCGDDSVCSTGKCDEALCVPAPVPPTCGAAQALDDASNTCVPLRGGGEPCGPSAPCGARLACGSEGTCVALLSDGASCASEDQCAGACAPVDDTGLQRACLPGLCQGR